MKPDALKGVKHFEKEEEVVALPVDSTKEVFWAPNGAGVPRFFVHLVNSTNDDYVVRVYKKVKSVLLPKARKV